MADSFDLLDLEEFARRMGVSRSTVFDWIARRRLVPGRHFLRVGKTLRFFWSLEALRTLTGDDPVEGEQGDGCRQKIRKPAVNMDF